jgi:hypothetical protein
MSDDTCVFAWLLVFSICFFNCCAHEDSCDQISCFLYQVGFFAVPFNAIVFSLGHMRATREGFDALLFIWASRKKKENIVHYYCILTKISICSSFFLLSMKLFSVFGCYSKVLRFLFVCHLFVLFNVGGATWWWNDTCITANSWCYG